MSKNIYKTAQGQSIDIDNLRLVNESTIAVGNMKVNARGDQVAPDGEVIKTRNELMKEQYKLNSPVVKTDKAKFAAKAIKRGPGELASAVAKEVKVEIAKPTATRSEKNTLRGSLAQSVAAPSTATPESTQSPIDDLQADLETIKPKSTIKRI